jgi:hypothetical protein
MQAKASKCLVIAFAAALCGPVSAEPHFTNSEVSMISGSVLVLAPFSLVSMAGQSVAQSLSSIGDHSRWKVTGVKEGNGGKTETEMLCDDGKRKLTMTIPTKAVREQRLAIGDQVDIDRVGKAGYVVKKGPATIGVLTEPGGGMVHSKARS